MAGNTVQKIGKYDVIEVLGKGGMGIVYKAQDARIGRLVAIKMMTGGFADNPDLLKRFYREAQSTGMLQHPNIVIIYDLGDQDGNPYLVMEYLEGEPLDKMIAARKEISLVEKLSYIIQCCGGLNYAHQRGIVHRDIKPANLMILRDGTVKIVDFGIARMGDKSMTRTGQVVGTITYMSPEQINAQVVDGRSDIFSTGVMLYELLTGALPFEGKDTASTLLKIIHEPPPPLKNFLPVFPPELEEVLHKALQKDREERYATAEDFAFDLSRVQEQLKKQMVNEYVERARTSINNNEFNRAKEILQQVLRVDTQHHTAKELMAEVQQRLQRLQRGEQVRQLRSHAEDAFANKQFEDAIAYVDQALTLDKSNTELLNLRDLVQEAKNRQDKVQNAIRKAEAAQQNGELEAALKACEDALSVEPDSAKAKTLYNAVTKELSERTRQKQLQGLLDEARRDISSRKFTAAFEVLKKAEQIDAASAEVHALLNLASSGREQEQRRRDVEKYSSDIEDALSRDDYQKACAAADEALKRFASDPGLLKLKALADKQRELGEKKRFVEEQMAAARKLLDAGKAADALAALEKALQKAPGDSRLASLLAIVRESAEREKQDQLKSSYVAKAKEAIRRKDYEAAVKVLESAQAEIEGSAEINDLLQFARDEALSHARRRKIDQAAEEAQKLMAEEEYERAVSLLEATMKDSPDEELRVVLTDARRHVEEFSRKVETALAKAQRMLEARKLDDAVKFLEGLPKSYARSEQYTALLEKARSEADTVRGVSGALAKFKESLDKNEFATASTILEACKKTYGETPEIKASFAEFEAKKKTAAKSQVDKAVRDARTLLLARQYSAALATLQAVAALVPSAPPDLQKQFESLNKDAAAGASRQQKEAELGQTIVAGSSGAAAQTIIAGSTAPSNQTVVAGSFDSAAAKAAHATPPPVVAKPAAAPAPAASAPAPAKPAPAPAPRRPTVAPETEKKSPVVMIVIAAIIILVVAIGGYVAYTKMSGPPPATTYITVNAIPWGTVKTVTSTNGKIKIDVNQPTPLRVAVPPGEYQVLIEGPNGQQQPVNVKATNDNPGEAPTPTFEQINVDDILNTN